MFTTRHIVATHCNMQLIATHVVCVYTQVVVWRLVCVLLDGLWFVCGWVWLWGVVGWLCVVHFASK